MFRSLRIAIAIALSLFVGSKATAQTWISAPGLEKGAVTVLHFRRAIDLKSIPASYWVDVSADNRFILYVNGERVGQGPARGDLAHWRFESFDLEPYLKGGHNVVAGVVWNAAGDPENQGLSGAPLAQISARTAFWLRGHGPAALLDTDSHWRVAVQPGHSFASPWGSLNDALKGVWYAAGGNEAIDGGQQDWGWNGSQESLSTWVMAVPALDKDALPPWHLVSDPLPKMEHIPISPGKNVRASAPALAAFPRRSVTIPANEEATLLIDQGAVVAGFPKLEVSGGEGAKITVTYAEALYDSEALKGDRNNVADRKMIGVSDTFTADGGAGRVYGPLWWRTWRYMEVKVKTGSEPLMLDRLSAESDAYPFTAKGYFKSNDSDLNRIWSIGWRTLRIDAHETFMDSAYWEQLQYVGDTRLENLIAYGVSGDPRLPAEAIDAFGQSARADGMIQSAYPSRSNNVIPTFALLWIGMLHDYWMQQPDRLIITRNLPEARKILDWYAGYLSTNGLLKRNPDWNFVDWVGNPPMAREAFPSFDPTSGTSCLTSLLYLGALKETADLEGEVGSPDRRQDDKARAETLADAIRKNCWDDHRGIYADDPSHTVFSQHTNALAVLYDVAPRDQAIAILDKVTQPAGIDAPNGILTTSYYFSWYLIHAYEHVGGGDRYPGQLQTWRDLLKLNFTTWPEERGNTRSDTHAWSAHPTADLLGILAGIGPAAPGYAVLRVEPHPGGLRRFTAAAATPSGVVKVSYRREGDQAKFSITVPQGLPGTFDWQGVARPLKSGLNVFEVSAPK